MIVEDKRIAAAVIVRMTRGAPWTGKSLRTLRIRISVMSRQQHRADAATMYRFALSEHATKGSKRSGLGSAVRHSWRAAAEWDTDLRRHLFVTHRECPFIDRFNYRKGPQ